jgi:hypothetical protein
MDLSDMKQSDIGAFVANVKLPSQQTNHHFFVAYHHVILDTGGKQSTRVEKHEVLADAMRKAIRKYMYTGNGLHH